MYFDDLGSWDKKGFRVGDKSGDQVKKYIVADQWGEEMVLLNIILLFAYL